MRKTLEKVAEENILILDGAMGTMIQRYGLTEEDFRNKALEKHPHPLKGNNDLLSITRPDVIKEIHAAYFAAGADIVETNTFSSTQIAQADYGLQHLAYELNKQGAAIAKEIAEKFTKENPEKPRFVAGSIGPTNRTASMSPDVNNPGFRAVTYDDLVATYTEQVNGLLDGGADILLVETVFDTLNAKAALFAIEDVFEVRKQRWPIMVSGTITDNSGRLLSGQTVEAFLISIAHIPLFSIGLNCALGAEQMIPYLSTLSQKAPFRISAHPNAGLPNEMGEYDETPTLMGNQINQFFERGLINIIGGCCGTTPDHIKEIARLASTRKVREVKA